MLDRTNIMDEKILKTLRWRTPQQLAGRFLPTHAHLRGCVVAAVNEALRQASLVIKELRDTQLPGHSKDALSAALTKTEALAKDPYRHMRWVKSSVTPGSTPIAIVAYDPESPEDGVVVLWDDLKGDEADRILKAWQDVVDKHGDMDSDKAEYELFSNLLNVLPGHDGPTTIDSEVFG